MRDKTDKSGVLLFVVFYLLFESGIFFEGTQSIFEWCGMEFMGKTQLVFIWCVFNSYSIFYTLWICFIWSC